MQKHKRKKKSPSFTLCTKAQAGCRVLGSTNLTLNPQVITNWTFSDKPSPEYKRLIAILLNGDGNGTES